VFATSNRHMRNEVREGRFREDLFYRLNVFPIQIPALRDRTGDILPLSNKLIEKHVQSTKANIPALTKAACERLSGHKWPGNVRELDNVIQRAMVLKTGNEISAEHIYFETAEIIEVNFDDKNHDDKAQLDAQDSVLVSDLKDR